MVEAPIYLQITRELHVKGLLEPSSAGQHGVVDTRGADRSTLRLGLLQTWERALIRGHLYEDVPLNRAERQAAIEHVSALACVGLRLDRLDVEFDDPVGRRDLRGGAAEAREDRRAGGADPRGRERRRAAGCGLGRPAGAGRTAREQRPVPAQPHAGLPRVAAAGRRPAGPRLLPGGPGGIRSRAGSSSSRSSCARGQPGGSAPCSPIPATGPAPACSGPAGSARPARGTPPPCSGSSPQAAAARDDNKVLDIYAAALEIDCVAAEPAHIAIAEQIMDTVVPDPRTRPKDPGGGQARAGTPLRRGSAHDRCPAAAGEAARPRRPTGSSTRSAASERSYPVQLAAAQEIGAGGDAAYQALEQMLTAPCQICEDERAGGQANKASGHPSRAAGDNDSWRAWIMSAWLAPMLAGPDQSAASGPEHRDLEGQARADLAQWLRHIGYDARRPGEEDLPITLEIALAQGFKYAANRRSPHAEDGREARMYLAEQALEMLKGARYWFSQLTLIQALCLLNVSDGPKPASDKHGAKPEAIVQHWLDVAGREWADRDHRAGAPAVPHPFVREAAQLAVLALKTGHPQRYCWIDESGVVAQVGSRNTGIRTEHRNRRLWIPPSAGWTALNGRAQQLVADVLLLLNLAERGDQPRERERRLKRANRSDLPPCITRSRASLNPGRTVGTATSSAPGTTCVDGCAFELCPYPPKGMQPRVEMSEAFCRRQQTLLTRRSPGPRTGSLAADAASAAHHVLGRNGRSRARLASPGRGDRP